MGYIDSQIKTGERLAYITGLHWAILLGPAMVMVIGGLSIPTKGLSALILLLVGCVWGIFSTVSIKTSEIAITDRRLIIRVGFPLRRTYDIPLDEIDMVDVHQPSLGKILNFGKVILGFTGKGRGAFRMVASPLDFRAHLEREVFAFLKAKDSKVEREDGIKKG
ncbi:MAG: PH domain-containing protein [Syntrophorhabdaceae bacterium]|nr:PH domain-containing protein [Syntrophorhabdaceae bacterium]